MKNNQEKIKYFLYARKSSESEDRQVQSIDDQVNRLKELARDYGLEIKAVLTEAKSAKKPNCRPVFADMLQRIENGEANGILCWQINRLSRNPIDSGTLSWALQQGKIKAIQTIDRQYLPEDNVLLFNVESGMANQFILDLSKNVKRGLQGKLQKGWKNGVAPAGYLNNVIEHTIIEDPDRFTLIRRAWDYMLTGNYTVPQILNLLNDEWGFRSVKRKKLGGKPMALSGLYAVFSNLFYAGIIVDKGQEYEGRHKPTVTLEEYDRVQVLLGRKGKPRSKTHQFAYTGLMRCEECGCMYTASEKKKIIKQTGELKTYVYYHCTRRKRDVVCTQNKPMTLKELEDQIDIELERYTILPQFQQWALEILNRENDNEIEDRTKIYEVQHKNLVDTQKELDELTKMRYRQLIDDETFIKERDVLKSQITKLKGKLRETESRAEKWIELTEKTFIFAAYARKEFLLGDLEKKREIFAALGQNFYVKDKKLRIIANDWFAPIEKAYPELEAELKRLELDKSLSTKAKTAAFTTVFTRWQGVQESNPRMRFWRPPYYHYTNPPY